MFMQDYGTETCGDSGTETCNSHICSCRTMVQRLVATVVQRLVVAIYVHAGLWYRDLWRLWYRGLWWLNLFMQDYGTETCGGYPGSLGYLSIDAQAARPYIKYLCAILCLMLQNSKCILIMIVELEECNSAENRKSAPQKLREVVQCFPSIFKFFWTFSLPNVWKFQIRRNRYFYIIQSLWSHLCYICYQYAVLGRNENELCSPADICRLGGGLRKDGRLQLWP